MSPSRSNGAFVFLIAAPIAVGQLGVSLYLPAIPGIGSELNIPTYWMSLTLTVYFAGFAFFNLFSGPFSDALGRRFMILRGLEVYGMGTLLCAMATDITMLLAGRTLQAFGAGVAPRGRQGHHPGYLFRGPHGDAYGLARGGHVDNTCSGSFHRWYYY